MGKGRDKELIKLRDEALCRRYYYWTEIQRLRFDGRFKSVVGARILYIRGTYHDHHPPEIT